MPRPSTANCSTVAAPRHCCCLNMCTANPATAARRWWTCWRSTEQHGLQLNSRELPDHLPLYLEYLAQLPQSEAVEGLKDIAPVLALLSARLQQRESRYAVLFDLLLKLANTAIDSDKVAEKLPTKRAMIRRRRWMLSGKKSRLNSLLTKGCGDSAITAHQRRFAGAVAPQYLNITTGGQH